MWIDHKSPRQKKKFPKYYLRYIDRHRYSILPRKHTRINTTKYSRIHSSLQCMFYNMKYKYGNRILYLYKKNTYHTCGYHSLSKTHTKTKDHPKPTLHPKYVFHTKNDLHPKYRLHPSHTLHSKPILLTKLYLKPKGHPKYKPDSHNNAYPNLYLHPKPKAHSKYIPHPKPHIAYNLYTKYKSQQTQYTQLKNKMASAYRPRHIIKIKTIIQKC